MDKDRIAISIIVIVFIIAVTVAVLGAINNSSDETVVNDENGIKWIDNYDEALKESKESDKKIFLYFRLNNCPYCDEFEGKTLTDEKVIEELNNSYICLKLDMSSNYELAAKYNIQGSPSVCILNSNGNLIKTIPGYRPADNLLVELNK